MDDFKKFIRSIADRNLNEVVTNFRTDFLERITDEEKKSRPIHLACTRGNLDIVKLLLQNQCSIECEDYKKWRPIHYACSKGHLDIVKLLLQNQCSLECETGQKWRPIHYACSKGHLDIVKLLLQNQCSLECEDYKKWRPIHYPCSKGYLDIVKLLLQNQCSLECETDQKWRPILVACGNGHFDIVKLLLQNQCSLECEDYKKWRSIHYACQNGHLDIVKLLLENRCSLECETGQKVRPIHYACQNGHLDIVKLLLENRCSLECETGQKVRPIHYACQNGHLDIVKLLLQNQCSLECETGQKVRPIHYACVNGHLDIVKLLLQNQCSLECEDYKKWRPIHLACSKGHLDIVKLLLQNQCSLECEDYKKWRPIHYACSNGNLDIVKYLILFKCHLESRTETGETPLEIARKFKHISCENFLNEILENRRKIFDCVKRNDAQALNRLYSSVIFMMEQPETVFSLLEVALQSNANEIIDYFLNKLVNVEEISTLEKYMKTHADSKLKKALFIRASSNVQKSIIEDLLRHFATNDEYDAFVEFLKIDMIEPKLFNNGETLLTSLLKDKNVKYCLAIVRHAVNKKYFNLANVSNQIPLQIAIETELYDLICPLIFKCDQINNEDNDGNTALMQLFQKLSICTDINIDEKLMTAVRTIISRGGDIDKETSTGMKIIDCCQRMDLRTEIEAFQHIERNKDSQMNEKHDTRNICMDRELELVFECGHTLCTPCSRELFICPMCNAELKNSRRLYI